MENKATAARALVLALCLGACTSQTTAPPVETACPLCPSKSKEHLIAVPSEDDRDPRNGRYACGWSGKVITPGLTYHVSPKGSDKNDGKSAQGAFATLQKAADSAAPGDTVLVHEGTYTGEKGGAAVLRIHTSGTEQAPIVFKAADGQHPIIRSNAWSAIQVADASYIVIDGFELIGPNQSLTLEVALSQKTDQPRWDTNSQGIAIWNYETGGRSHHVIVNNNRIHDFGGSGIVGSECDCITVADNTIYSSGFYTIWVGWGIIFWQPRPLVQAPGYKMVIRGNRVFDIWSYVPYVDQDKVTEPLATAAIMLDLFTQHGYAGPALVEGNTIYRNQGCGIQNYQTINVDVVNNTLYENLLGDPVDWGEYCDFRSHGSRVYNNVFVAGQGHKTTFVKATIPDAKLDNNLHWPKDARADRMGPHSRYGDPKFLSLVADGDKEHAVEKGWDFHLKEGSAAINGALPEKTPALDAEGKVRLPNGKADMGAFEH